MNKTAIEWTDFSSNPLRAVDKATGKRGWACTAVSAGCDHCYSEALNRRWGTGLAYDRPAEEAVEWELSEKELTAMLTSKATGARVFVADMTDLFHVRVRREWLDRIFAVFALRPDLTFQCLTKRPALAAKYLSDPETPERVKRMGWEQHWNQAGRVLPAFAPLAWPLPNVWLGTSVEDNTQRPRIALLKRAPAAVHFLSCEPLIGPLDLTEPWLFDIEWVIAGGESGARHRPLDLDWARAIRDACLAAGVPYFWKQVGGLTPKSGGRLLDGQTWDQFPKGEASALPTATIAARGR